MTVSERDRIANLDLAIRQMMEILGDKGYMSLRYERDKDFAGIFRTTWNELERRGYIEDCSTMGNPQFKLTGYGWIECLRHIGRLKDSGFRDRIIDLKKRFQRCVKDRDDDAFIFLRSFASEEGLDPIWIMSVVDSDLLSEIFPDRLMRVDWLQGDGSVIHVPVSFGQTRLPE